MNEVFHRFMIEYDASLYCVIVTVTRIKQERIGPKFVPSSIGPFLI